VSTTGTNIVNRLNIRFDDSSDSKFSSAVKLAAINAAIDTSFPLIRQVLTDSTVTISSNTYEYSPTATPDKSFGFSQAYCTVPSNPKVLLRRVAQRRNANGVGFTILLPSELASEFSGQTLSLVYNARTAEIAALTESIDLPVEFLEAYASFYLCSIMALKAAQFEVSPYSQMMKLFEEQAERYKQSNRSGFLASLIPMVFERGGGDITLGTFSEGSGRYGQNYIPAY